MRRPEAGPGQDLWRAMVRAAAAAGAVGLGLGLAQCDRWGRKTPPAPPTEAPAPVTQPATVTPSTLGRAEIVSILAQAASAHAAGRPLPTEAMIAGRSFEVRLPFGCGGRVVAPIAGLARWDRTEDGTGLRLSLSPADWSSGSLAPPPPAAQAADAPGQAPGAATAASATGGASVGWDRIDGFWIARPWLSEEICPAVPSPVPASASTGAPAVTPPVTTAPGRGPAVAPPVILLPPPPPSPMTAGLAVIQRADASRLGGLETDYSFVVRGEAGTPIAPPADGYRLVVAGRIGTFPDGRPIRCVSDGPERRPACIAAVAVDLIAFDTADGRRLSEWRPSS